MSKTIVFCADGTWNGPDELTSNSDGNTPEGTKVCEPQLTNVCKLFAWLDGDLQPTGSGWGGTEMEKFLQDAGGTATQVAKYIHGVGDSQKLLDKAAGGAFGVGVVARIARGYTYISRNFVPGDSIVIVGFSRGAYTARALADLIAGEGLLRPDFVAIDDDTRYDTAVAVWYRWRHGHDTTLQKIVDGLAEFLEIYSAFPHPRSLDASCFVPAKITAVAVWDTVGTLGIPDYFMGAAVDLFRFNDSVLNPNVSLGLHAVSLHEQRKPFAPTLWEPNPNVTQAVFPGGHCDIGGGYAEHGLSDGPLLWVVDRLQHSDVGLKFKLYPPVEVKSDPLAAQHREWKDNPAWLAAGVAPRTFPVGVVVNDSIRQHMNAAPENVVVAAGLRGSTVKWFNDAKGFGFITPDGGAEDLFAHFSEIKVDGFKTLQGKQRATYEVKIGGNTVTSGKDVSPFAVPLDAEEPPRSRQIRVTGHSLSGELITVFAPETKYVLNFCVAAPSEGNLARGHVDVTSVPSTGLTARWIVTSENVAILAVSPVGTVMKRGDTWLAEFDLTIPAHGDSAIVTLDVCTTEQSGQLMATLLVAGEEYRKLTVTLGFGACVTEDVVCTAPDHLNLGTFHEWTTPPEHLALNVLGPLVCVSTIRGTKDYGTMEWIGNSTLLKNPIDRVRRALEKFRVAAEAQLNDLDVADMDRRLHTNQWKPYDWSHLPGDGAHEDVCDSSASGTDELRALANEGYRLFDTCFPRNSELRAIIAGLEPGSRLDFVWTSRGAVDWVSHVPWALMYLEPVKASEPVNCERFLGLRYRIGSKSWEPNAPSAALGDPALVHALHFLYWGTDPTDEVAAQSLWQRSEFGKRTQQCFLPDGSIRDFKGQLVAALETPEPHPAGILYFYCHCSVKDGSDPVLQFGETAKSSDTVNASEIYSGPLEAGPLVFANACTTVAADPLGTSELESRFFARNIRAFLGTETKVPVALASRFAWLFFQFFFRTVDPAPMAAGEALAQARHFLWTQYHNPGGLFYCLVNRYDLYLASDEEVAQLQRK